MSVSTTAVGFLARVMAGLLFNMCGALLIDAVALAGIAGRQVWIDPGVGEAFSHFIAGRQTGLTIVDLGEIECCWTVVGSWRR